MSRKCKLSSGRLSFSFGWTASWPEEHVQERAPPLRSSLPTKLVSADTKGELGAHNAPVKQCALVAGNGHANIRFGRLICAASCQPAASLGLAWGQLKAS